MMAFDAVTNNKNGSSAGHGGENGVDVLSRANGTHAPVAPIAQNFNTTSTQKSPCSTALNRENKKAVFIIGTNAPAHYVLREALDKIAGHGIPCEVYTTDVLPKGNALKEKISRPEVRNFSFYERLMINHGYSVLEKYPTLTDDDGDLEGRLMYTPNQIAQHFTNRGIPVTVKAQHNVNDPDFISQIAGDNTIARAYNIRGMQIMSQELIDAFENKTMQNGHKSQIINCHPGDVILYPGTNIAFWNRMNGSTQNIWTLHVVDSGIDTGPSLDKINHPLKPNKTLLQDMMVMAPYAAQMIANDLTSFLSGTPRPCIPQHAHMNYHLKPEKNYTYAEHEDYLEAARRGIKMVNPQEYIKALAMDYTGSLTSDISRDLQHTLAKAVLDWQNEYLALYTQTYGTTPPEYDPANPDAFFVRVPPASAASENITKNGLNGHDAHNMNGTNGAPQAANDFGRNGGGKNTGNDNEKPLAAVEKSLPAAPQPPLQ